MNFDMFHIAPTFHTSSEAFVLGEGSVGYKLIFLHSEKFAAFHTVPPTKSFFAHQNSGDLLFSWVVTKSFLYKQNGRLRILIYFVLCVEVRIYHSLDVGLCDTWTEDMARSRAMTLGKTNINPYLVFSLLDTYFSFLFLWGLVSVVSDTPAKYISGSRLFHL